MQYHFSLHISDTDIGVDVEGNPRINFVLAISRQIYQLLKKTCGYFGVIGITRLLDFLLGY